MQYAKKACLTLVLVLFASTNQNAIVKAQEFQSFTEPYKDVRVAAGDMGVIHEVRVQLGDFLNQGDLIARLDDEVLQDSLVIARAAMENTANRRLAELEVQMREKQLQSYQELFDAGDLTSREFQNHLQQADQARARLSARLEETQLRNLEYQRVQTQIRKRSLFAPISGFIVEIAKREGEFVSPTDPVVVRIVDISKLRAVFSIPWKTAGQMKVNDRVPITIGQMQIEKTGLIESIVPIVEPGSGSKQVVVVVENDSGELCSGLPCLWDVEPVDGASQPRLTTMKQTIDEFLKR